MGLLYRLTKSLFGVGSYVRIDPVTTTVGTSSTRIVQNNPDRVGLIITNNGASTMRLLPRNDVSTTKGVAVFSGGSVTLKYDSDFETVGSEWYAIASGAATTVTVIEVIASEKPEERE